MDDHSHHPHEHNGHHVLTCSFLLHLMFANLPSFSSLSFFLLFKGDGCCSNNDKGAHTIDDHSHKHEHDHKSDHGHSHEHMDHPGTFESRGLAMKRKYDSRAFVIGIGKQIHV